MPDPRLNPSLFITSVPIPPLSSTLGTAQFVYSGDHPCPLSIPSTARQLEELNWLVCVVSRRALSALLCLTRHLARHRSH